MDFSYSQSMTPCQMPGSPISGPMSVPGSPQAAHGALHWGMHNQPGSPWSHFGMNNQAPAPASPLHMPQAMPQVMPQAMSQPGSRHNSFHEPVGKAPQEQVNEGDVAAVVLMGLPAHLCNYVAVEAMLEQAGLEDAVMNFNVTDLPDNPQVFVHLLNRQAAKQCIAHFHGRQWGSNGGPVMASLMKPSGRNSPDEALSGNLYRVNTDASVFNAGSFDRASTSAGTAEEESGTDENGYVTDDGF